MVGKAILDGMDTIKRWLLLNWRIFVALVITLVAVVYLDYAFKTYPKREADRFQSLDSSRQLENCELTPLTTKEIFDIENESRKTMAQIFGGLFILIGLFFAYKRQATAEETLRVTERGQITDRFTKAIEQLGKEQLELRLGAIYGLEKIAHDSAEYHWQVMEVLTAYVRARYSWKEGVEPNRGDEAPLDLEAVMSVLRRRKHERETEKQTINLSETDLRKINLIEANLQRAQFDKANLQGAMFSGANLQKAWFDGANLQEVGFFTAKLQGVMFRGANLRKAQFSFVDMQDAMGLTQEQFDLAMCDGNTILPFGVKNAEAFENYRKSMIRQKSHEGD